MADTFIDILRLLLDFVMIFQIFWVWVPIVLLFRYYLKTRILDYLLLGLYYLAFIVNAFSVSIWYNNKDDFLLMQIVILTYVFTPFLFVLHAARIKWQKTPISMKVLFLYLITSGIIYQFFLLPVESLRVISTIIIEINRIMAYLFVIYAYITTQMIMKDERIKKAKTIWIIAIMMTIFYPLGSITIGISSGFTFYDFLVVYQTDLLFLIMFFITIMGVIGDLLITFIAIKYPDAFIFSQAQIIRALRLQDYFGLEAETRLVSSEERFGVDLIVKYMEDIPQELISEFQRTN